MRVLHVAEAFGGGLLQMVVDLSNGLAREGHQVTIAHGVRPETPDDLDELTAGDVRVVPLPWTSRRPATLAAGTSALRRLIDAERPDVVHLHSSFAGVLGTLAAGRGNVTVFSPHAFASAVPESSPAVRAVYRVLERAACRRATLVGAVSRSEAEMATAMGAKRTAWVHNGIESLDPGRPDVRSWPPQGRPLVVAGGRTVAQRRPDACARILGAVADLADVEWLGGGGGRRGVDGRRALEEHGIPLSGWMPREQVLDRLRAASAYLHFTSWDGLPYSLLEAVALDVPVVASDIAPNREVLGGAGLCGDEAAAVELLRRLLVDPAVGAELLEEQRRRRAAFGLATMVDGWITVYRELLGEPSGADAGDAQGPLPWPPRCASS